MRAPFPDHRRERLRVLFDEGIWTEHHVQLASNDPLHFTDTKAYRDRLRSTEDAIKMKDAVVVATGRLDSIEVVVAAVDAHSSAAAWASSWERRSRRRQKMALDHKQPLIVVSCSAARA